MISETRNRLGYGYSRDDFFCDTNSSNVFSHKSISILSWSHAFKLFKNLLFPNADASGYSEVVADDGVYKRALQMFFVANQMGLVDPDSPSQDWDTTYSKMCNGQTLFSFCHGLQVDIIPLRIKQLEKAFLSFL